MDEHYEHQLGPDYIIPTEEFRIWKRDGAIKINLQTLQQNHLQPISIPSAFEETVKKFPNVNVFYLERDGINTTMTFSQFYEQVRIVAKAFIKLGLKRLHPACILGFNSPEWIIAEVAAIFAGGLAVGIYPTNFPESCKYVLRDSSANLCLVDTDAQLEKILKVKDELPELQMIIQWLGKSKKPGVLTWDELLEIGKSVPDEALEKRLRGIAINQPCFIIYTSGTTAQPKGVLLNHDNIIYGNMKTMISTLGLTPNQKSVSFLPLNHMGGQIIDVLPCILCGQAIHFAKPDALKGSLMETLIQARPTIFLGVPRIYEKMYTRIRGLEKEMSLIQRSVFSWAKRMGLKHTNSLIAGSDMEHVMYGLAKSLVFAKIHKKLGLSNAKTIVCSTAPIDEGILEYFRCLDIFIIDAYGLSETANAATLNLLGNYRAGSVGKIPKHIECKIVDVDKSACGEICFRGRQIFMGYLNNEKETSLSIDGDQWFHTGDLGRLDAQGFLYITGRKKELLVTAGGENIAPVPIEETIKKELDIISNAMAVADKRKFLSILLTLKTEVDAHGNSTGNLTQDARLWLRDRGSNATTVAQVLDNITDSIRLGIQCAIDAANQSAISNAAKIQKWIILPHDFSQATGELGPTMKLCRHVVVKKYKRLIDSLYPS